MALVYLAPAVERPVPSEDPDSTELVWVPEHDPDNLDPIGPDWDRIWYAGTTPPKLIRTYRGNPPPPTWAQAAGVVPLGEFPDDLYAIRKWAAAYFREGDRSLAAVRSSLADELSKP